MRLFAALALSVVLLAGCSNQGSDNVDCGVDQCTITFQQGVSAEASVLGIEAKLLKAEGESVTLKVAGEEITLTVGQAATEIAGLQVYLDSVTKDQVKVRISRW